jgi:peroxiredoxin
MKRFIYLLAFTFVASLGSNAFASGDSVIVDASLNFTVQDVDGNEQAFSSYLGKGPVLVNFWALWCEPCKQEMKAFKTMVEKFKAQGVSMVAINTDKVKSMAKVRNYVKSQGIEIPVLLDPDGSIAQERFAMESLPYSLILNPDGSVYKKHTGFTAGDELSIEKEVEELLHSLSSK